MELKPEIYQTLNYLPKEFALKSFDRIANENKEYDVIVDIGPGDGGLSKTLATRVPHKRLVLIDIDPNMIAHVEANNKVESMEFVVQDMSVPWDRMGAGIRALEGKAGLIFSNFTLHFVPNKHQLLSAISKVLATGGSLHANFIVVADVTKKLDPNGKYPKFLSVEKQVDIWRQGLADNGLKASRFEVIDSEWHLRKEEILAILPVFVAHYNTITESGHKFDVQSITDAVFDAYVNPKSDVRKPNALNELKANPSADKVVVHMKIMSLIATK